MPHSPIIRVHWSIHGWQATLATHGSSTFLVKRRDLVVAGLIDRGDDLIGIDLFAVLDRDGLIVERNLDVLDAR